MKDGVGRRGGYGDGGQVLVSHRRRGMFRVVGGFHGDGGDRIPIGRRVNAYHVIGAAGGVGGERSVLWISVRAAGGVIEYGSGGGGCVGNHDDGDDAVHGVYRHRN